MPILGFGTFLSQKGEIGEAIKIAIASGYRHIDCAPVYGNEKEIGVALQELFKQNVVTRGDLFITSKLPPGKLHPEDVEATLKETLLDLQLEYLDLYLVHLPIPVESVDGKTCARRLKGFGLQDTWRKMESCYSRGLTKAIGVSNYSIQTLNDCLNYAVVPPVVNQIERHPFLPQLELLNFCKLNNVYLTAYGALGAKGFSNRAKLPDKEVDLLDHNIIKQVATRHGKSPAQVLIRWSVDSNVIVIPKSVNETRIKENFNVADFKLTQDDMNEISTLGSAAFRFFSHPFDLPYSAF